MINTLAYQILKRRKNIVNQVMSEKNEKKKPNLIYNPYTILGGTTIIILTILIEKTCLLCLPFQNYSHHLSKVINI